MKRISKQYEAIHLKARSQVEANGQGLTVHFEGGSAPATDTSTGSSWRSAADRTAS